MIPRSPRGRGAQSAILLTTSEAWASRLTRRKFSTHGAKKPRYEVSYLTGWDARAKFPETPENLSPYDVVILSDVDSDSLPPRAPMGPNRLKSIQEYVRRGGALLMIGGYATFTGRHNAGNYHGTPVEEAVLVNCLAADDDRMERPRG